jgi:hypothetical protein
MEEERSQFQRSEVLNGYEPSALFGKRHGVNQLEFQSNVLLREIGSSIRTKAQSARNVGRFLFASAGAVPTIAECL